jgi:hypothetical protein
MAVLTEANTLIMQLKRAISALIAQTSREHGCIIEEIVFFFLTLVGCRWCRRTKFRLSQASLRWR